VGNKSRGHWTVPICMKQPPCINYPKKCKDCYKFDNYKSGREKDNNGKDTMPEVQRKDLPRDRQAL